MINHHIMSIHIKSIVFNFAKSLWKISTALCVVVFLNGQAIAQEKEDPAGIFERIGHQEMVPINLSFNISEVTGDRRSKEKYQAVLSFEDEEGQVQDWWIELSLRGRYRRMKCTEMPPLKLHFKKKDLEKAGLSTFNDMKLVTLCMDDDKQAEELLLREYLAYKLYNQLTPVSYRVQLLEISYRDINTGSTNRQLGFLIEDTAQLRSRIAASKVEEEIVTEPGLFDPEYRKIAGVFQYMIGNADWGITKSRNVKYISKNEKIIPVPYDFDFSALVNASYAVIANDYGQSSFQDRVYLGFEDNVEELETTLDYFEEKKDDLLNTVKDFKLLNAGTRREMLDYLENFFKDIRSIKFPVYPTTSTSSQ